jgi:hypothetical protein
MALFEAWVSGSWHAADSPDDDNHSDLQDEYTHERADTEAVVAEFDITETLQGSYSTAAEARAAATDLKLPLRPSIAMEEGDQWLAGLAQSAPGMPFAIRTRTINFTSDTRTAGYKTLPKTLGITHTNGQKNGFVRLPAGELSGEMVEGTVVITTEGLRRIQDVTGQAVVNIPPAPNSSTWRVIAEEAVVGTIQADSDYSVLASQEYTGS